MKSSVSLIQDVSESSLFNIATEETLEQSISFVNERLESMGLGTALQFQRTSTADVVEVVNCFYRLMERLRLQKKYLEESRANTRRQQSECDRITQEKQQLQRQLKTTSDGYYRDLQRVEHERNEALKMKSTLDHQVRELRVTATQAVNKWNLQSVTMKQLMNENAGLRGKLTTVLSKQQPQRRVFRSGGDECEAKKIDVFRMFESKLNDGYETQIHSLRERVKELELMIGGTQEVMSGMVMKHNDALTRLQSTPVKMTFPTNRQSIVYATPQMKCISLFGGGEEIMQFAESKVKQFEAQLDKMEEADQSYSAEKLRGLLREANEVIREQMSLLQTVAAGPSVDGDALSFLEEGGSDSMDVEGHTIGSAKTDDGEMVFDSEENEQVY